MRAGRVMKTALSTVVAAVALYGVSNSAAWSQARYGNYYQEFKQNSCDTANSDPCTVQFSVSLRAPLKILKASCTVLTSEGIPSGSPQGTPSREITGIQLGRVNESGGAWVFGQALAPVQTEFTGAAGQIVINVLSDTLLIIPKNYRPAIRVSRLNKPPVAAQCSIVGEEITN